MNRRGEIGIVGKIIFMLVILVVSIVIFTQTKNYFVNSLSCSEEAGYTCKIKSEGCGGGERIYGGVFGCGKGEMCCLLPKDQQTTTGGGPGSGSAGQDVTLIGPTQFTAIDSVTKRTVLDRSTISAYTGEPKQVLLEIGLPPCKNCRYYYEGFHMTKSEQKITVDNIRPYSTTAPVDKATMLAALKEINLVTNPAYVGEIITYTLIITPNNGTNNGTKQIFTFRYKVDSPVAVTPLSTNWAKSKQATVTCTDVVGCNAVFYTIQTNATECKPIPAEMIAQIKNPQTYSAAVKEIPVRYCLVENGKLTRCEYPSLDACYKSADSGSGCASCTQALQALRDSVSQQQLNEQTMSLFLSVEQQRSPYTCQADLNVDLGGAYLSDTKLVLLNTTFNRERQQAIINLNRNFMSDRYLCVYGQDSKNPDRFYIAGKPQLIRIDTTPPVATVTYKPFTKTVTFACEDDKSGCKETYWIQYISDVTKFFPALMAGNGQSAAVWCPPAQTTSGWRAETRYEVPYTSNEVRVLCLRVEDNAGNAGVSKTTVYDAYAALQTVLQEYIKNGET